jgi:hypothetical protein
MGHHGFQLVSIAVGDRSAAAARRDSSDDGPSSQSNQRGFRFQGKICGGERRIAVSGQTLNSMKSLCLRCPYSFFPEYMSILSQAGLCRYLPAARTQPCANSEQEKPLPRGAIRRGKRLDLVVSGSRCGSSPCHASRGTSGGTLRPSRRLWQERPALQWVCDRSRRR